MNNNSQYEKGIIGPTGPIGEPGPKGELHQEIEKMEKERKELEVLAEPLVYWLKEHRSGGQYLLISKDNIAQISGEPGLDFKAGHMYPYKRDGGDPNSRWGTLTISTLHFL